LPENLGVHEYSLNHKIQLGIDKRGNHIRHARAMGRQVVLKVFHGLHDVLAGNVAVRVKRCLRPFEIFRRFQDEHFPELREFLVDDDIFRNLGVPAIEDLPVEHLPFRQPRVVHDLFRLKVREPV
jgi:hypothetical protein